MSNQFSPTAASVECKDNYSSPSPTGALPIVDVSLSALPLLEVLGVASPCGHVFQ
jgi:hypothetical protein